MRSIVYHYYSAFVKFFIRIPVLKMDANDIQDILKFKQYFHVP